MKIMHVIGSVNVAGAETMLYKLVGAQLGPDRLVHVVSLTDTGPIGSRIEALGVPVTALGMKRGRVSVAGLVRLVRLMAREKPDLVQTWMYHSDLIGGIAAKMLGIRVIWGVRHEHSHRDKPLTRLTRRVCSLLSTWIPESIVFNSESSLRGHVRAGYATRKVVVIPNGFDLATFHPDPRARTEVRRELGIPDDAPLVGLVARYHPDKDHRTFAAAATRVRARCGAVHFLLCGEGTEPSNRELSALLDGHGLRPAVHALGKRSDLPRLYAALDVACLSSRTESFPNVIGEAMACGTPCVATECGAVREMIGDTGRVVPVGDPEAFAAAVLELVEMAPEEREALGRTARARVSELYGLESVARRFHDVQVQAVERNSGDRSACG